MNRLQSGDGDHKPVSARTRRRAEPPVLPGANAPYRALVEQMQEGALALSARGDVLYANPSFVELAGRPLDRIIGTPVLEFVEEADRSALGLLLAEGSGAMHTRLVPRGRAPFDVHISVSELTVDGLALQALVITDLAALTKTLREHQSKEEFLAMLAHELRNPLAPLRTGLQVLKLSPTGETAERTREVMDRQLTQMIRLIDDLLDISRVSRGRIELRKETLDLRSVIGLAIETSLPLIEAERHQLLVRLGPDVLPVHADATRLAQVFSNLLNNAAKYTPSGGRIDISAERQGSQVNVRVRDDGVGIPRERLPEVFEMFSQVGRNFGGPEGGLGVGLTLVKKLVEMHGGSVRAESGGPERGSVFVVTLPMSSTDGEITRTAPPLHSSVKPSGRSRLRVLIVDDNLDGAQMLSMLVGMQGHAAETAHTGPDALDRIEIFEPGVVFLDIGLPGLNGYEVAKRIRALERERGRTPVVLIALTGWGSEEDKRRSSEAGFDLHLTKPVDAKRVEEILGGFRDPAQKTVPAPAPVTS